jgi:hypothetical protein
LGDFARAEALLTNAARALGVSTDASLRLLVAAARGELAYEARRVDDAHRYFSEAAAYLADQFPDLDALTARAYVGLIEAGRGDAVRGRAIVRDALEIAKRSGYFSLQARCRLFLAQIDVAQRQFREGVRTLDEIPADDNARSLAPELRAQVEIWRGRARAAGDDPRRGAEEQDAGRRRLRGVADRLDEAHRHLFLSRPRIAEILP